MRVVGDTDILSTFARIKRLDVLKKLFEEVVIPNSVKQELVQGKIVGIQMVGKIRKRRCRWLEG